MTPRADPRASSSAVLSNSWVRRFSCAWVRARRMRDCLENKSMRLEILRDLSGLEVSMADLQGSKSQRNSKKQTTFKRVGARPVHGSGVLRVRAGGF